ncbi:MAG: hypothetical protein JWM98_603, partial [Thermoleophilia bacterium]|nr:hypothetical protein [Thermoleophilia bacterium]
CTLTPPAPVVVNCPAGSTTPTAPTLAQCVPVAPQPVVQHLPIMLCHADNGNGDDFYTLVSVDDDSITKNAGHDGHAFDVIPAFTYATGSTYDAATNTWTVTTAHYDGKNLGDFTRTVHFPKLGNVTLTLNGANMLTNGCTLTPPAPVVVNCPAGSTTPTAPTLAQCVPVAPQPVIEHLPITLCHADNGNGDDFYTLVSVDDDSITKNAGHDGHAFDVIPAFTYATGSTYNAATNTWTVTTAHYDGKNLGDFTRAVHFPIIGTVTLTLNGATMLTSGCALAAPGPVDCPAGSTTPTAPTLALCGPIKPAQPVVQHLPITVCHAGISNGDDTYALVSADDETIPTADGHGGHAFDVIPAFTYTTGFTYDAGANAWIATTATYAGKNLGDFTRVMHFAAVGNAAVTLNGANMLANGCALTPPDAPAVVTDLCVNLPGTQAVVPAGLVLLAGACVAPAVVVPPVAPTNVDVPVAPTVPQAPTVEPDPIEASGGPSGADADPIDAVDTTTPPVKAVDPDEAKVVAARADDPSDHSLPFTGLSLSLLLALGFGGVLLGSSLHTGARNRRRERTSDRDA